MSQGIGTNRMKKLLPFLLLFLLVSCKPMPYPVYLARHGILVTDPIEKDGKTIALVLLRHGSFREGYAEDLGGGLWRVETDKNIYAYIKEGFTK